MSARELLVALGSGLRSHAGEIFLAATLIVAGFLIVDGVAMLNEAAARILSGLLVAGFGYLFLTEAR